MNSKYPNFSNSPLVANATGAGHSIGRLVAVADADSND